MNNGWIKLYRKLLDDPICRRPELFSLFVQCLLLANHEDNEVYSGFKTVKIPRGSFITSLDKLSKQAGLSVQTVRTCLNSLKLTNKLTNESTKQYTFITIINFDTYQRDDRLDNIETNKQTNTQLTNGQQTANNQVTINNNINNDKNDNKELFIAPTLQKRKAAAKPQKPKPTWNNETNRIDGLTAEHLETFKRAFKELDIATQISKCEAYYLTRPDVTSQPTTNWLARINKWLSNAERFRQRDADREANRQNMFGGQSPHMETMEEIRARLKREGKIK